MTEPKNAYFSRFSRKSMKIESIMMKFQGESIGNHPRSQKHIKTKIFSKPVRLIRFEPYRQGGMGGRTGVCV